MKAVTYADFEHARDALLNAVKSQGVFFQKQRDFQSLLRGFRDGGQQDLLRQAICDDVVRYSPELSLSVLLAFDLGRLTETWLLEDLGALCTHLLASLGEEHVAFRAFVGRLQRFFPVAEDLPV